MSPISKRLKIFRTRKGLSMRDAARLIGVPESTYREWEYGRQIRGEPYMEIAKAFDVSIEALFGMPESSQLTIDDRLSRTIEELIIIQSECKKNKE